MTQPARYDIQVKRRADYFLRLQIKDSLRQPVSLVGYDILGQAWDQARLVKYADFAIAEEDRAEGRVTLSLSAEDTENLPEDSWYDVLMISPSGVKEYYVEGVIYATEGYTEQL